MVEPDGYSQDTMEAIASRYTKRAAKRNASDSGCTRPGDTNIVLVLSEAFSDPTRLKGVQVRRKTRFPTPAG